MLIPKFKISKLVTADKATIEYVEIGSDNNSPILLIPGAGDGLSTVGKIPVSLAIAQMYRKYADQHKLIVMSRREPIPHGFTVRDFAKDYVWAMEELHIQSAHIETNSGGGPIGQWLAIDFPKRVKSLVLGETMAYVDDQLKRHLLNWIHLIQDGNWYEFRLDTMVKTYSDRYIKRNRWWFPMLRLMRKPKSSDRIIHVLEGLLELDNRPYLHNILCPTLVIGGDTDQLTRLDLQTEMARLIPSATQLIMKDLGHGANLERMNEHTERILSFYRHL